MRECYGETVSVFESASEDLGELLRDAAEQVDSLESGYFNVNTYYDTENSEYVVTLYAH